MTRTLAPLSLALALGACLCAPSARAATCPVMAGASLALADVPAEERLRFIERELKVAAHDSWIWALTWGSAYAALTAINAGLIAAYQDPGHRTDFYVGAGASAVGVATLLISPPAVLRDQRRMVRLLGRGDEGPCEKLAEAERLLAHAARSDAFGTGPLIHGGSAVFNIGIGVLLGFGLHRWTTAIVSTAVGMTAGEIMTDTRPTGSISALRRYQAGRLVPAARPSLGGWALAPDLGDGRYGARLVLRF